MENSSFTVKKGNFEGPLDLLLQLVEDRKFFINDISLAEVTNDYIAYVNTLSKDNTLKHIGNMSGFLIIASTLVLIKSKSLLPNLTLTKDEEDKIQNLEERLRLYQIIKNASIQVKNKFGTQIIFSAGERDWNAPLWNPDKNITKDNMLLCIQQVLQNMPEQKTKLPEIEVKQVITIEEMINSLVDRIEQSINFSFKEFSGNFKGENIKEQKVNVIVSFLAMLELVREGIIDVMQESTFNDITISKNNVE